MPDVPAARILHHDREHRGMKMKMEVAVDMVQRKTGCVEFLELRRDFPGQLLATAWIEEKSEAGGNGAVREPLLRVDQIWNVAVGQGGVSRPATSEGRLRAGDGCAPTPRLRRSLLR